MRKLIISVFAALFAFSAFCDTEIVNGVEWNYEIEGGEATIGEGYLIYCAAIPKSTSGNIAVPIKLGGYPVTVIGEKAFEGCDALTSITIPCSVTKIGDGAFERCDSLKEIVVERGNPAYESIEGCLYSKDKHTLIACPGSFTSIEIPDSVTEIGDGAFDGCKSLSLITIPNSVTEIGRWAFAGTPFYENLPDGFVVLGNGCLYKYKGECPSEVTVLDSVMKIGSEAFYYCSSLKSVTISNSVTEIGERAFEGCKSLKSVTIPDSVTEIGDGAFEGCKSLKSVTIPSSVTEIGGWTFAWCTSLESITIPDSVTKIERGAFKECKSLKSVTIPDSVTEIGDSAFSGCSSLTSITIPSSVTEIGDGAFKECMSLSKVYIDNYWEKFRINSLLQDSDSNIKEADLEFIVRRR